MAKIFKKLLLLGSRSEKMTGTCSPSGPGFDARRHYYLSLVVSPVGSRQNNFTQEIKNRKRNFVNKKKYPTRRF